ncbi:hypothetical protein DID88_006612 [Monilinia fructigena]|uniref:Uncharacterized protein n=1 Tax=Monilinia fructigena TaxID=38457 RepID=A0A395IM91_9HELO|nr:hypothetical protein DID88_006612 [Monilinia fructigena]
MDTEDGQFFIKNLAHFVRTHEKALANALQLRRQQAPKHGSSNSISGAVGGSSVPSLTVTNQPSSASSSTTSSTLAAALSLPYLTFASHNVKPAKLALTPHHLFYLLSRFEDLGVPVGPMNVRLENLHADTSAANYVSFLSQSQRPKGRGSDSGSVHSVSSVRSVMSGMSSLWSNFGLGSGSSAARTEKQKAAIEADLKYLYSAFTKIPCLRLAPDRRARLIEGYEEFPFDSAVPLLVFKNISALEISDIDIRQFFGWDKLAEQLRSLTVKRAGVDDPADLLINIVLDDMDKRRRRSSKAQMSPTSTFIPASSPRRSPTMSHAELVKSSSAPGSPDERSHIIDTETRGLTRAGYTERRHLVERVAERPGVPVVKPPPPDYGLSAIEINKPIIEYAAPREPAVLRKERPVPVAATSEINTGSTGRRRRTPKRRIVDLSTSETSPSRQTLAYNVMPEEPTPPIPRTVSDSSYGISPDFSPRTLPTYIPSEPRQSQRQSDIPRINTSVLPRLSPMPP